jgi:hypothetical protein
MGFHKAKRDLKAIYDHSDSESSDNECRKMLYVMFEGSWDITPRRIVMNLRREVAVAALAPRVTPHHRWMETLISFDASDCPKSMIGAGQLPLLVSLTIVNIKLYHVLIDGGAALNLISFQKTTNTDVEAPTVAPILWGGSSTDHSARMYLPPSHIRDA